MTNKPQILSMLAPTDFHAKLSRRALFRAGTAAAGLAIVATACGGESSSGTTEGSDTTDGGAGQASRKFEVVAPELGPGEAGGQ